MRRRPGVPIEGLGVLVVPISGCYLFEPCECPKGPSHFYLTADSPLDLSGLSAMADCGSPQIAIGVTNLDQHPPGLSMKTRIPLSGDIASGFSLPERAVADAPDACEPYSALLEFWLEPPGGWDPAVVELLPPEEFEVDAEPFEPPTEIPLWGIWSVELNWATPLDC